MMQNLPSVDLHHILDHTRDAWEDLRNAHIFITGGTGFFGCWLLESFVFANRQLNLNASVSILTRTPDAVKQRMPRLVLDPAISLIEGDVRTFAFPKQRYSHILHAATDASAKLNNENPLLMLDTIIEGTRHVLDLAVQCRVERLLMVSSGAVYGRQPSEITHVPEDYPGSPDPLDPASAYGIGKRTAEQLCALYAKQHGISSTIARCFAFVGPHLPLNIHFAIGNFIRDAIQGIPIVVKGDGTPYRSYLYAADLAIWLWTIFLRGSSGQAYNVGSEEAVTIAETAQIVANEMTPQSSIKISESASPSQPVQRYVPSTRKARVELGLKQWVPVSEGVRRTISYCREISL
jgi:nucleoside-diphosphate-sugar epimerase